MTCPPLASLLPPPPPPQLLQWLEMCNTPGKGKITPQPLYEFKAEKVCECGVCLWYAWRMVVVVVVVVVGGWGGHCTAPR